MKLLKFIKALPLVALLLLIAPYHSFSQETKEPIPDGTQGEVFKSSVTDTSKPKRKYDNWNEFDGPLTTLKLSGGFLYEFVGYAQDDESKEQIETEPTFKLRDFRVTVSGLIKIKRELTWKAGLMYDGPSNSWFIRETGVMVGIPEISGHVFVGRTKEGFSLNKVMNGYSGWTLERQMGLDIIPILADGIKYIGFLPKQRLIWNIGIYTGWVSKSQSFTTFDWQFAARIGWLPVYSGDKKPLLHIGASYRYGKVKDGEFQARSRPESFASPFFVDAGKFPANHSNHVAGELYFRAGSLLIGSEYNAHLFSSTEAQSPILHGGEVVAMYVITGEIRPYSTVSGIFGFMPVKKPVFRGGPGAWEAVLRLSNMDLDDGTLTGGKFWRFTPMVNWYLSENVRFCMAYGFGILDRFNQQGSTHFFQTRIQLML